MAVPVVLALSAAVALHHDGMAMGGMAGHHDMSVAMEICLGVMTVVAAVAFGVLSLGHLRPRWTLIARGRIVRARPPLPRARAGPLLLCLICVSRR